MQSCNCALNHRQSLPRIQTGDTFNGIVVCVSDKTIDQSIVKVEHFGHNFSRDEWWHTCRDVITWYSQTRCLWSQWKQSVSSCALSYGTENEAHTLSLNNQELIGRHVAWSSSEQKKMPSLWSHWNVTAGSLLVCLAFCAQLGNETFHLSYCLVIKCTCVQSPCSSCRSLHLTVKYQSYSVAV